MNIKQKHKFREGDIVIYHGQIGKVRCLSIGWKPALVRGVFDENRVFGAEWIDNRYLEFKSRSSQKRQTCLNCLYRNGKYCIEGKGKLDLFKYLDIDKIKYLKYHGTMCPRHKKINPSRRDS